MSKVTIQRDICLPLIIPLTATHNFIPLPPFPPIPPPLPAMPLSLAACAIEAPVNAWWPPGGAFGSHKFTSTVFHNGMQICLDGHDCGKFIPHLQVMPAPNNMLTFIHIPFSSRKANFSSASVLMNGSPTACMTMIAWPPTPMTYCAEPLSMPLADAPTSHFNTVEVRMSLADWLAGALNIAVGMMLEWVTRTSSKDFGKAAGKDIARSRAGQSTASLIRERFINQIKGQFDMQWLAKQTIGALTGAAQIALTGQGSISVNAPGGGGFFSLGGSVSRSGGEWGGGVSGSAATVGGSVDNKGASATSRDPLGRGQDNTAHEWGKGTTTTESRTDPFNGFQNTTTTRGPDGTTVTRSDGPTTSLPNQL
ncbi:MAG TPA: hypothetical protein VGB85_31845 [Nannocystis sp.]|jgi:hypothetical protein